MTAPPVGPPDPAQTAAEITPFRDRTAAFLKARGHGSGPLTVTFGPRTFSLTAQDRGIVWNVLCQSQPPAAPWQDLLCSGVALQLGLLLDTEELVTATPKTDSRASAVARLETTLALGRSVAETLQRTVEGLVAAGDVDQARQITAFKSGFGATLRDVKTTLAAAADPAAPAVATQVPPEPAAAPGPTEPASAEITAAESKNVDVPSLPQPPVDRDDRFEPYLERLRELLRGITREQARAPLPIGARSLRISSWQRQLFWPSSEDAGDAGAQWQTPLVEASALQLVILQDLAALDDAGEDQDARQSARGALERTAELAQVAIDRLRAVSTAAIGNGDMELAKKLSSVRNGLVDSLMEARKVADLPPPAHGEQAQGEPPPAKQPLPAPVLTTVADVEDHNEELSDEEERAIAHASAVTARRRAKAARPIRRQRILISCAAVLAVLWVFLVLIPSATKTKLRVFELSDFQSIPTVEKVVGRPPSLYVTVTATRWQAMSAAERTQLVKSISDVIAPEKYSGATLWTAEGRVVAIWLSTRGITIMPDTVTGGPPT